MVQLAFCYKYVCVEFYANYKIIYLNFMVENYQGSAGNLYQQPNKTYVHICIHTL